MTETEIRALWVYAQRVWRNFQIAEDSDIEAVDLQVWQRNLGDIDVAVVQAALDAEGGRDWPPPVGVIRDRALELELTAKGEPERPSWEQSWDEMWDAVRRRGRTNQPEWHHPITADVVRAIGYDTLCDTQMDDVSTVRAQFRDMHRLATTRYERLVKRPTRAVAELEVRGRAAALERWNPSTLGAGE